MCGIVGFIGHEPAKNVLMKGLKKLEYRGYDSAGISLYNPETKTIDTYKKQGKISVLSDVVKEVETKSFTGIGHTRWATHGKPSDANAHPHSDAAGMCAVVHNGIVENYSELRDMLVRTGRVFSSETDTEVIPNLLAENYRGDFLEAVELAVKQIKGSYALCIMCCDFPDAVIAVKHESPLVIGEFECGAIIASDITALAEYTDKVRILENGDVAVVTAKNTSVKNGGAAVDRQFVKTGVTADSVSMEGFESFMYKEILEVPGAIARTVELYRSGGALNRIPKAFLRRLKSIQFIGCGTAYHAGLVGKAVARELIGIEAQCEIASEFRYEKNFFKKDTLFVFISQSGETADTLGAVKAANAAGAVTAAITNVVTSSITRVVDFVLPIAAGPEIAVASTKAYSAQVAAVYALCFYIAEAWGMERDQLAENMKELLGAGDKAQKTLASLPEIMSLARSYSGSKCVFFIGRGIDYAVAQEGSLKLKEISYVMSEAYPSGELKHGTLALIEKDTPVIALITQKKLLEKSLSALHEVRARGAKVICFSTYPEIKNYGKVYDYLVELPPMPDIFTPLVSAIPLQLFAYFMTRERGFDPDKPRNLAKSVTVE